MNAAKPDAIGPGDTVAAVAPSGPVPMDSFSRGVALLEAVGFRVIEAGDLTAVDDYLAGTDEARTAGMASSLGDESIRAVFCARGGYGSMRILPALDKSVSGDVRKPVIGFSDATALEMWLLSRRSVVSIHGPLLTTLAGEPETSVRRLFQLLSGEIPEPLKAADGTYRTGGRCTGTLAGGNLSIICALAGTGFLPDFKGSILFLEDVNEEPYRIDRMLTQLDLAGLLGAVSGIAIGNMCPPDRVLEFEKTVRRCLGRLPIPVVTGFGFGHCEGGNMSLPQGVAATLDAAEGTLTVEEPAVRVASAACA